MAKTFLSAQRAGFKGDVNAWVAAGRPAGGDITFGDSLSKDIASNGAYKKPFDIASAQQNLTPAQINQLQAGTGTGGLSFEEYQNFSDRQQYDQLKKQEELAAVTPDKLGTVTWWDINGKERTTDLDQTLQGVINMAGGGAGTQWYNQYWGLPADIGSDPRADYSFKRGINMAKFSEEDQAKLERFVARSSPIVQEVHKVFNEVTGGNNKNYSRSDVRDALKSRVNQFINTGNYAKQEQLNYNKAQAEAPQTIGGVEVGTSKEMDGKTKYWTESSETPGTGYWSTKEPSASDGSTTGDGDIPAVDDSTDPSWDEFVTFNDYLDGLPDAERETITSQWDALAEQQIGDDYKKIKDSINEVFGLFQEKQTAEQKIESEGKARGERYIQEDYDRFIDYAKTDRAKAIAETDQAFAKAVASASTGYIDRGIKLGLGSGAAIRGIREDTTPIRENIETQYTRGVEGDTTAKKRGFEGITAGYDAFKKQQELSLKAKKLEKTADLEQTDLNKKRLKAGLVAARKAEEKSTYTQNQLKKYGTNPLVSY